MLLTVIDNNEQAKIRGYNYVIYSGRDMFHFFSSNSAKAYKRIIKKLGFQFCKRESEQSGKVAFRWLEGEITNISFTNKDQLPKGARKIKALSNGSIVTCYYKRDLNNLLFFRPNPNYKDIYKPLSLKKHIKHVKKYGVM